MNDEEKTEMQFTIKSLAEQYRILHESRAAIMESLAECVFIVETIAHLQGKERELLPMADRARALLNSAVNK